MIGEVWSLKLFISALNEVERNELIMKNIKLNEKEYEIVYGGECLKLEELEEKFTDYFDAFDFVFGDYAYEKLRLKGFYESTNKKASKINDIKYLDDYKKNYCSYGAKTFLIKKIK